MITRKQFFRELLLCLGRAANGDWPSKTPESEPPHASGRSLAFTELSPSLIAMEAERLGMNQPEAAGSEDLRRRIYAQLTDRAQRSVSDSSSNN